MKKSKVAKTKYLSGNSRNVAAEIAREQENAARKKNEKMARLRELRLTGGLEGGDAAGRTSDS